VPGGAAGLQNRPVEKTTVEQKRRIRDKLPFYLGSLGRPFSFIFFISWHKTAGFSAKWSHSGIQGRNEIVFEYLDTAVMVIIPMTRERYIEAVDFP
jgi:hypothetical protein